MELDVTAARKSKGEEVL